MPLLTHNPFTAKGWQHSNNQWKTFCNILKHSAQTIAVALFSGEKKIPLFKSVNSNSVNQLIINYVSDQCIPLQPQPPKQKHTFMCIHI